VKANPSSAGIPTPRKRRKVNPGGGLLPGERPPKPSHSYEPPARPPIPFQLDHGIKRTVESLRSAGVETIQSCEGGPGHAYPEPTIEFSGIAAEGWKALAVCLELGLPVCQLRHVWEIHDGSDPAGPHWEITFWRRPG